MENLATNDCILVSVDFSHGVDVGVLIVGRRLPNGYTAIVNAFQGDEAVELYKKLVTVKEKENA